MYTSMRKALFCFAFLTILQVSAYAGFLAGNSSPYVEGGGHYAMNVGASMLMAGTPFSSACLTIKYGLDDNLCLMGKYGKGAIDYSTISGTHLTWDPIVGGFGFDYLLSGKRTAEYYSFVLEYETATWGINNESNTSNETLIGFDYSSPTSDVMRTRYRLALHNFYAGTDSEEKIATSVKYSLSTEIEYCFTKYFKGSFQANFYLGDPVGGTLSSYGVGLGLYI